MRVLALEEVLALPLQRPHVLLPDDYGSQFYGWFRFREGSRDRLLPYVDDWRAATHLLPIKERVFPDCSRPEVLCASFLVECLVTELDGLPDRRLPGCLYLKIKRHDPHGYWGDSLVKLHAEHLAKVEDLTGGRAVLTTSEGWVVETWFEHPPGYVWETYRLLLTELGEKHPFVQSFGSLVFDEDAAARRAWERRIEELDAKAAKAKRPALVRPRLIGPDLTWRFSANPWWVQTILFARLMGGTRWMYVWGALEALHGKVTDWTSLSTSNGDVRAPKKKAVGS